MLFVLNFLATTNVPVVCSSVLSCTDHSSCRNTFLARKIASLQDVAGRCKKLILNFTLISRALNAVSLSEDSPARNIPFVIDSSLFV